MNIENLLSHLPALSSRNFMQETGRIFSEESCLQKRKNLRIFKWGVPQQKAHQHHSILLLKVNKSHLYNPSCQSPLLSPNKNLQPRTTPLRNTSNMQTRDHTKKKKRQPGEHRLAVRLDTYNPWDNNSILCFKNEYSGVPGGFSWLSMRLLILT